MNEIASDASSLEDISEGSTEPSMTAKTDTLIVSDIHLGSDVARSKELLALLNSYSYRQLILNGDVFDDLDFTRLSKDDWRLLSYLRKASNPRKGKTVVWVVGNHDGGVAEILSHLLGVDVYDEYVWDVRGRKMMAIHGHQFDKWITDHVILTAIATWLYWVIQKLDPNHNVARWVKRKSKKYLRASEKVGKDAVEYSKKHGASIVTCGHTHMPIHTTIDGIEYVNSGSWTEIPSTFITVSEQGEIVLNEAPSH